MSNMAQWRDDLLAGLTGAVAGAPQAMGFALIAGIAPIYGLYTAVVSTIVGAILGQSSFMTVGPTNALALVVATTLVDFEGAAQTERLFVLTALTGVFYLIFAIFRLGFLLRFVSNAVMTGFVTGAGLLIIFGQVQHLNGYNPTGDTALLKFLDWLAHLHRSDPATLFVGVGALLIMVLIRKTRLKNVSTLIAIVTTSVVVLLLNLTGVTLVRDISAIPQGLPAPLALNLALVPELAAAALAIAILGAVQSAAIVNAIPETEGKKPHFGRDLFGMGVANIAGGYLQGMPACGSLSRTAVNVSAGGRTRYANAFAGVFVALTLLSLGFAIEVVTLAALGAQLILAAISLIEPRKILAVWRVNLPARLVMVTTFASTMLLPLEYSIYIGVGLSLILYLYTSSQNISVNQLIPLDGGRYRVASVPESLPNDETIVLSVRGSLYFAAVQRLQTLLPDAATSRNTTVIIRLREAHGIGSTAVNLLAAYHLSLRERGGKLMVTGVSPEAHSALDGAGLIDLIGAENVFDADDVIFSATNTALGLAEDTWTETPTGVQR